MSRERRRAPRVAERIPLALTDATAALQTETKNLSASGAYCALERFIPPMTKLEVQLDLPNGAEVTRIRCSGVVVRIEPVAASAERVRYDTAIFFTDLTERDRLAISEFVRRRLALHKPS